MRPLFATIDTAALKHNLGVVRRRAPRSRVLAVIKANAYGHGLMRAAAALSRADGFALLELEEAVRLREAGFGQRIVLLEGFFDPDELSVLLRHRLGTVVHSMDQVAALEGLPGGAQLDVLLKVNTGMNRLGIAPSEYPQALERLQRNPGVGSITLATHFADADDARGVDWQLERLQRLPGFGSLPCSLANSAAILRYPETHRDWVRPGIMLYGCSPFPESTGAEDGLKPAMTLETSIIAVQELKAGDAVGYGGAFRAERRMRVGVVACGYADGYPRHAPTGTPISVAGRMTRTLGRVSMDMLCADLTELPEAGTGARVVLWGDDVPVERVAEAAGTVGYQLLCAVTPRVRIVEK
ncbi:MAG TPA: alanine racemase [Burkholderiales bacterium]|nr:alanine racemase [Burkholderiales bacterium]